MSTLDTFARPTDPAHERALAVVDGARETDAKRTLLDWRELTVRAERAAAWALPKATRETHEDIASEVVLRVIRRHGTDPRGLPADLGAISRKGLALEAVTVWRDARQRVAPTDAESLDVPTGEDADATGRDFLASATGHAVPADDWQGVARALRLREGSPAWDAVRLTFMGHGYGAASLALERGMTPDAAKSRIRDGKRAIRDRYPDPDALVSALWDADAGELPLAVAPTPVDGRRVPVCPITGERRPGMFSALRVIDPTPCPAPARVRLSADARLVRSLLDTLGLTNATLPTVAPMPAADRTPDPAPVYCPLPRQAGRS